MSTKIIQIDNDNYLQVSGLRNGATAAYVNDATVTATLKDSAGTDVPGQAWPLGLSYVPGSDGVYRGVLQDSLTLTAGDEYKTVITAVGGGLNASWTDWFKAGTRSRR